MNYNYVIISRIQIAEFKNENESKFGYYWGINSLINSNLFLKDNESIESFNRTKKWLQENHPELML
jgi:hypothetical protein